MKLTIKKEVEETIEIELPAYRKNGSYSELTKIMGEKLFLSVEDSEYETSIKIMRMSANDKIRGTEIEKSVFNNSLQSALSKLTYIVLDELYPERNKQAENVLNEPTNGIMAVINEEINK